MRLARKASIYAGFIGGLICIHNASAHFQKFVGEFGDLVSAAPVIEQTVMVD